MNAYARRQLTTLIILVVAIFFSAFMAYQLERDFGKVDIQVVRITDPSGVTLVGKLYRPVNATFENTMPGVLNLHGYQNDKDVQAPFSIELARRGFVVLALDALGHGDSGGGLEVGFLGVPPYTVGTNTGYQYLKSLPFVDAANLGVMGHSMGAINSLLLGYLNPDHRALNFQCGVAGDPSLKNVLLTQSRYDEFAIFREGQLRVEPLATNPARLAAFGQTTSVEWDTTYGSFADGTARRAALINMEHHFLPLTNKAVAEAVDWMRLSLKGGQQDAAWIDPTSQIFLWKELFGMVTLLTTTFSLIPLTNLLLATAFFKPVVQPIPNRYVPSNRTWWIFATLNALIGGILYPPLTAQTGLSDKVQGVIPFLKLPVGNGLFLWFLVNAVVCGVLFFIWYRTSGVKAGVTMYDVGASFDQQKTVYNWGILGKTLLMGVILFAWMYVLEGISQWLLGQEFRFAWPFMRQFSEPRRFGYFLIYLIPALAFFLINGGVFLFGQARQKEAGTPARTQWIWWLKNLYAGLAGLVLVWAIQYLPWYLTSTKGPGFEELGLPQYSALWPLMLQVYVPEFAVLLFLLTWFYRRTGRVYLGALVVASLAMWFLTAGTVISK